MADVKITALTVLTAADPINDAIPIVDVSNISMAASGTTSRISINNLLSSSPTATGALTVTGLVTAGSASITGAATVGTTLGVTGNLTVDTTTLVVDASNDRVGIGTATPAAKLIVRDGSNRNLLVSSDAAQLGSAGIAIGSFTDNAAGYAPLSIIAGTSMAFGMNGSTAMTLNASGNLVFPSAKGIDFSAVTGGTGTATANVLNDYEEGTFTPTLTFGGASVGMIGTFSGRYTKVGRAVTVSGLITITARGTSTGNALITGLPFTSAAGDYVAASLRLASISFTDAFQGYVGQSSTAIVLEQITNAGTESALTHSNFSVGSSFLIWNCTYTV